LLTGSLALLSLVGAFALSPNSVLAYGEEFEVDEPGIPSLSVDVMDLVSIRDGSMGTDPYRPVEEEAIAVVVVASTFVEVPGLPIPGAERWSLRGDWILAAFRHENIVSPKWRCCACTQPRVVHTR
jgi:hypothetical protein